PALPDPFTAIATFPDERSGLQTVADFMAGGGVPSLLEFLDGSSLRMLNDYGDFGLDAEAGAMLIMQVDQSPTESEAAMETFAEVARRGVPSTSRTPTTRPTPRRSSPPGG